MRTAVVVSMFVIAAGALAFAVVAIVGPGTDDGRGSGDVIVAAGLTVIAVAFARAGIRHRRD